MPEKWTENRKKVFGFLERYFERHDRAPTLNEIAEGTQLWKRSVEIVLKGLERMGVIEITPGISRGIRISGGGEVRVPLLGEVRAGAPALSQEESPEFLSFDKRLVPFENPVALRVQGYSMKDAGIRPGDVVLLRAQKDARNGDTVVAWHNGGLTVKTLSLQGRRVRLLPANPTYKEMEVRKEDDFAIVGRVMLVLRDLGECFDFRPTATIVTR